MSKISLLQPLCSRVGSIANGEPWAALRCHFGRPHQTLTLRKAAVISAIFVSDGDIEDP
jgi:hypothetical protein